MKTCSKCGEGKGAEGFHSNSRMKDGLHNWCKSCVRERAAARRDERLGAGLCHLCGKRRHTDGGTRCVECQERTRGHHLRLSYGATSGEYAALLVAQGGGCAICGARVSGGSGRPLHLDHCHRTGRIRGVLCFDCNVGIGKLGDSLEGVERAVRYLRAAESMTDGAPERTRR